jgi:hypothetical protein
VRSTPRPFRSRMPDGATDFDAGAATKYVQNPNGYLSKMSEVTEWFPTGRLEKSVHHRGRAGGAPTASSSPKKPPTDGNFTSHHPLGVAVCLSPWNSRFDPGAQDWPITIPRPLFRREFAGLEIRLPQNLMAARRDNRFRSSTAESRLWGARLEKVPSRCLSKLGRNFSRRHRHHKTDRR